MSVKFDCKHFVGDDDCNKCSVMGYIFECPDRCEEYKDFFGRQPYKEDLEKKLRGEA